MTRLCQHESVGRDDKRLCIAALCIITGSLAAALLLGHPHGSLANWSAHLSHDYWPQLRPALARKNVATVIQAAGSLIAFYGLLGAYLRAKHNMTVWDWVLWRLGWTHRGQDVTYSITGALVIKPVLSAPVYGRFVYKPWQRSRAQLKRLAIFVNDRSQEGAAQDKRIDDLAKELQKAVIGSSDLKREILERIESKLKELDDKLNRKQVLELTWAIWGIGITAVGAVAGFGT